MIRFLMFQNKLKYCTLLLILFCVGCDTPLQCSDDWDEESAFTPILAGDTFAFYASTESNSRRCSSDAGADSGVLEKIWRFYKIPYKEKGSFTKLDLKISEKKVYSDVSYHKIREDQVLVVFRKGSKYDLYFLNTKTNALLHELKDLDFSSLSEAEIAFSAGKMDHELLLDGRSEADFAKEEHNIISSTFDVKKYRPYGVLDLQKDTWSILNPDTLFVLENKIWLDIHYADDTWRGFYKENDSLFAYIQKKTTIEESVLIQIPKVLDGGFDISIFKKSLAFRWRSHEFRGASWFAKILNWAEGKFDSWQTSGTFDFSDTEPYTISRESNISFIDNSTQIKVIYLSKELVP